MPKKILIIQTAFIGDVILATCLIENIHKAFPDSELWFLLRKGNENLLAGNPHIKEVMVWDKKRQKLKNLGRIIARIRRHQFDIVFNLQRFFSSGLITALSGAKETRGYSKNPLSYFFTKAFSHQITQKDSTHFLHEVDRNNNLLQDDIPLSEMRRRPKLYPSEADEAVVEEYKEKSYITISPASVWFTKQWPMEKWIALIQKADSSLTIYLLGGKEDNALCEALKSAFPEGENIISLAGRLSFLQSAALMQTAVMNFVNDSAPLHIASAMNAPVTVIFCSTVPTFGFGPLSDVKHIWQVNELYCRPCGLHGYRQCPEGHFKCAWNIEIPQKVL